MSYTIILTTNTLPEPEKEAWEEISKLQDIYYKDESEPVTQFNNFLDRLTASYPCLCSYENNDPAMEDSPWADGPIRNNFKGTMGMLAMVSSCDDDVLFLILDLADEFDITVADTQTGALFRKPVNTVSEVNNENIIASSDSNNATKSDESISNTIIGNTKNKPWWKFWN